MSININIKNKLLILACLLSGFTSVQLHAASSTQKVAQSMGTSKKAKARRAKKNRQEEEEEKAPEKELSKANDEIEIDQFMGSIGWPKSKYHLPKEKESIRKEVGEEVVQWEEGRARKALRGEETAADIATCEEFFDTLETQEIIPPRQRRKPESQNQSPAQYQSTLGALFKETHRKPHNVCQLLDKLEGNEYDGYILFDKNYFSPARVAAAKRLKQEIGNEPDQPLLVELAKADPEWDHLAAMVQPTSNQEWYLGLQGEDDNATFDETVAAFDAGIERARAIRALAQQGDQETKIRLHKETKIPLWYLENKNIGKANPVELSHSSEFMPVNFEADQEAGQNQIRKKISLRPEIQQKLREDALDKLEFNYLSRRRPKGLKYKPRLPYRHRMLEIPEKIQTQNSLLEFF